ncbi:MAG: hypothetical protein LBC20_17285 [Planctomycetaceae bacterium]|jgi:hypothetical protein|nr:hypothetical protein [Planctomycetaceae bacterium]
MRLTSFGIVLVLVTSFLADQGNAQIPERVLFQPGSYAFGPYYSVPSAEAAQPVALLTNAVPAEEPLEEPDNNTEENSTEENKTEWETTFGVEEPEQENEIGLTQTGVFISSKLVTVPYLAYHRNPLTHRIHVVPYQPGYAAEPEAFPEHQSKLNLLLSTLPSREQNRPQVRYASYYDPDPVIITDKPSRLQLILGYPNASWTSCCENRWGVSLAQCPGVEPVALGPYAEAGIKDQPVVSGHSGPFGGIFSGLRPLDYGRALPLPPHYGSPDHHPVYSREVLRKIVEQRPSYAVTTEVPVPQPIQSIPYPPFANRERPLPPPKELHPKTTQAAQPLSPSDDNQSCEGCKECKNHVNSCPSTSCKSCATKTAHRCSLKSKKTVCGTENKEK